MKIGEDLLLHVFTHFLPSFSGNEFMVSTESQTQMESVRLAE